MSNSVRIEGSAYRVVFADSPKEDHLVKKDRTCSCGEKDCLAIKAVGDYLRAGGKRAPEPLPPCPVCGGSTYQDWEHKNPHTHELAWVCNSGGRSHYLQAKAKRIQENMAKHPRLELMTFEECRQLQERVFRETGYNPAM